MVKCFDPENGKEKPIKFEVNNNGNWSEWILQENYGIIGT